MPRPFNPFPVDGLWYESDWYNEVSKESTSASIIARATSSLKPHFTADWARSIGQLPPHPFAWHYNQRGGVRKILELGVSLDVLDSPPELTADITNPSRYNTRAFEAWAGALFVQWGAAVIFIPEKDPAIQGKRPEFEAEFADGKISVEAKELSLGDLDKKITRGNIAMIFALMEGKQILSPSDFQLLCRTHATILPGASDLVLELLEYDDFEERCRELGRTLLEEWLQCVKKDENLDGDGYYSARLKVAFLSPDQNDSGDCYWESVAAPTPKKNFQRVRRNLLLDAGKKLNNWKFPGVIVLNEFPFGGWSPELLDLIRNDLIKRQTWATDAGAILIRHRSRSADPHAIIDVLPGPRWEDLPASLTQGQWVPCPNCGVRHLRFDPLSAFASE